MTDSPNQASPAAAANSKPRSKGGVPRVPLATAETYARALWNTARRAEAMPVAVARAISGKPDTKAEGGAWRTKAASLRVFSLVARLNNENLKLSDIGLALVDESNPDGQMHARRQAILSVPSYLKLLADHNGNPLPAESTVATTFEYQYELPTASAKEAAAVFASSVKHAGLLDDDGNIRIDTAEVPEELEPESSDTPKVARVGKADEARTVQAPAPAPAPASGPTPAHPAGVAQAALTVPLSMTSAQGAVQPVGVSVTLDMSKWQADDVLRVLAALGFEAASGSE